MLPPAPSAPHPDRHRCLASAGQRRGPHADHRGRGAARHGPRGRGDRPGPVSAPFPVRPIQISGCRCCRAASWSRMIEAFAPDALHIATEGPLGLAARGWAMRTGFAFTTAFHTRFAEYIQARTGLPVGPIYAWMRHFHGAGQGIMVATQRCATNSRRAASATSGLVARRRSGPVQAGAAGGMGSAAADLHLCRPRRGGEEHRRVPRSRPARLEGRGRRRAELAALQRDYPRCMFTGPRYGEALAAPMRARTCLSSPA